jgi:hypothetical protein
MEQDHATVCHTEDHPRDTITRQAAAHLPKARTERRAVRTAYRSSD